MRSIEQCHTYCDMGHLFIMIHLQGLVTLTPIVKRLAVKLSLPSFYELGLLPQGFEQGSKACGTNALTQFDTAAAV